MTLKGSRTVWDGGKASDNFKGLPIVILLRRIPAASAQLYESALR